MGRTPRINKNGGRDHWGNLGPLLLAGGGLKMGQVIGQSNRDGGEPQSEPVRIQNLIGDDPAHAVRRRPAAAGAGHAARDGADDDRLGADSGLL